MVDPSDSASRPPSYGALPGSSPDVAVVMPVRNEESTLADAVASVLAQEFDGSLEVCIAVAPSVDETRAVADSLAASDGFCSHQNEDKLFDCLLLVSENFTSFSKFNSV